MNASNSKVFWSYDDLLQAAKFLTLPSEPAPELLLTDSEQIRRVFTLIYDVLRYKSVLDEALESIKFYRQYPTFENQKSLIWLLFYDLFMRDFEPRPETLDEKCDGHDLLSLAETLLCENRVKLGAALSKMRIKSGAYDLENLLPAHLQNSRNFNDDSVICGWINHFKTTPQDVFNLLKEVGFSHTSQELDDLSSLTYKLDNLLPRYIHCRPPSRDDFINTSLFSNNSIVMQERTFCLGPAVMNQLIKDFVLFGDVVQTHVSSLPTVAYLANLLTTNENANKLLVFSAGNGKGQCKKYLKGLGVNNTTIYSENFTQLSKYPKSILENVIGVLATPPNTNSNVQNPVDLAVARGGDLSILEQLTSDNLHDISDNGHIMDNVLTEQHDTLRVAMSKPQVQFIVYVTHSLYDLENSDMVSRVIAEMNGYATERHIKEIKDTCASTDESIQEQQKTGADTAVSISSIASGASHQSKSLKEQTENTNDLSVTKSISVTVPPTDLFELATLPDLCPQLNECITGNNGGTYIAVIKRKEITRWDLKHSMKAAEESTSSFGERNRTGRPRYVTKEMKNNLNTSQPTGMERKDRAKNKSELDRITAPTHSTYLKDKHNVISDVKHVLCQRHIHHLISLDGSTEEQVIEYFSGPKSKRFDNLNAQEEMANRLSTSKKIVNPPSKNGQGIQKEVNKAESQVNPIPVIEYVNEQFGGLGKLKKLSKIKEEDEDEPIVPPETDSNSNDRAANFTDYYSYFQENYAKMFGKTK